MYTKLNEDDADAIFKKTRLTAAYVVKKSEL
jgi:hypothetical protein